jgi:excisionase family DNA binding protein
MSDPKELLTVEEFARRCGIGRTMVYTLINAGEVRSIKLRRRRLIPELEISALIARKLEEANHA